MASNLRHLGAKALRSIYCAQENRSSQAFGGRVRQVRGNPGLYQARLASTAMASLSFAGLLERGALERHL